MQTQVNVSACNKVQQELVFPVPVLTTLYFLLEKYVQKSVHNKFPTEKTRFKQEVKWNVDSQKLQWAEMSRFGFHWFWWRKGFSPQRRCMHIHVIYTMSKGIFN